MYRTTLKCLTGILLSLGLLQNSWAIVIEHRGGDIYASVSTNDSGVLVTDEVHGFAASGQAVVDTRPPNGSGDAFGFASGLQTSPNGQNNIHFTLTTTAEQANEVGDTTAHETRARVTTAGNPDGRIHYQLAPEAGEENDNAQLTIMASLEGSLISARDIIGMAPLELGEPGTATVSFDFSVYADIDDNGVEEVVATFSTSLDYTLDASGFLTSGSAGLQGDLGTVVVDGLQVGDEFSVAFDQVGVARTNGEGSSARAFGIQSNSDIVSISIEATTVAVPEPSTLFLFGSGMLLAGVSGYRRQRQRKV